VDALSLSLVSAALAALIVFLFARSRQAETKARLQGREDEVARLNGEVELLRRELRSEGDRASGLQAELKAEKASSEARLLELRNVHEKLKGEFAELSAVALRANRDDFLALAQQAFGQLREASAGDLTARQNAVASLVQPIRESLAKVDERIGELERSRATAYGQLGQQLESLQSAQQRLHAETGRLAATLSATRTAGTWGEVQLRRVVELAGMMEHCDFEEQSTPGGGERDRADMIVNLPG